MTNAPTIIVTLLDRAWKVAVAAFLIFDSVDQFLRPEDVSVLPVRIWLWVAIIALIALLLYRWKDPDASVVRLRWWYPVILVLAVPWISLRTSYHGLVAWLVAVFTVVVFAGIVRVSKQLRSKR